MSLTLRWQDVSGMERLGNALGRLDSHQKHLVLQRAVNHTGERAKVQVARALAKQTGLNVGVIKKALRVGKAYGASTDPEQFARAQASSRPGSLIYVISSKGGDISLKFFKPTETRRGVTAKPFGKSTLFAGAFMRGGRFPDRNRSQNVPTKSAASLNGHVYTRTGSRIIASRGRRKDKKVSQIELKDSGVIIPEQMIQGASADAFKSTVASRLPGRVMHEIKYLCPGIFL